MTAYKNMLKRGFTLIELLIVMAILGVLAVVVLVAINPAEQLARTRDAGRVSGVTQMGHAVESYYTSHNATWPLEASWSTDLTAAGELSTVPAQITSSNTARPHCTGNVANLTWCYQTTAANGGLVFATAESNSYASRCPAGTNAYIVFSTADGKGGVICRAAEPADPWASATETYY